MRFSQEATDVILGAAAGARELGHGFVGSAHLMLSLAREQGTAGYLLRQLGLSAQLAYDFCAVLYGVGSPGLPLPQGFSGHARKILRCAAGEAELMASRSVKSIHILIALTRREKAASAKVLRVAGLEPADVLIAVVEGVCYQMPQTTQII